MLRTKQQADLVIFLRQLAVMLTAGIPILRCLEILTATQSNPALRKQLHRIQQQLIKGHALHRCLSNSPSWFDHFSCELIHLGEEAGKLDCILPALANHHEHNLQLKRQIYQALFYPCLLGITACCLTLGMFTLVIPTFADLFENHQQLPFITRCLFSISSLAHAILPWMLLPLAILILTFDSKTLIKILMRLPPLPSLLLTLQHIRFSRNLSIALTAGIPILHALKLTTNLLNQDSAKHIRQLQRQICTGTSLYKAMDSNPYFPDLLKQMTKTGEESGCLDLLLLKTAEILETELRTNIQRLTALLEPLIITVQGVLIGGLVIGMYLPLFNLGNAL